MQALGAQASRLGHFRVQGDGPESLAAESLAAGALAGEAGEGQQQQQQGLLDGTAAAAAAAAAASSQEWMTFDDDDDDDDGDRGGGEEGDPEGEEPAEGGEEEYDPLEPVMGGHVRGPTGGDQLQLSVREARADAEGVQQHQGGEPAGPLSASPPPPAAPGQGPGSAPAPDLPPHSPIPPLGAGVGRRRDPRLAAAAAAAAAAAITADVRPPPTALAGDDEALPKSSHNAGLGEVSGGFEADSPAKSKDK